jgi:hypothetical protein
MKDEGTCESCGGFNPVWYADNDDWNRAVGRESVATVNFLCPRCFIIAHEESTGEHHVWALTRSGTSPSDESLRIAQEAAWDHGYNTRLGDEFDNGGIHDDRTPNPYATSIHKP